jgi:hypothetical protein
MLNQTLREQGCFYLLLMTSSYSLTDHTKPKATFGFKSPKLNHKEGRGLQKILNEAFAKLETLIATSKTTSLTLIK